jgi:DNA repair protein RecO (recombination protein O)
MITKTNAIILRIVDFSNTSQIITCLSKEYGKVTLSAKGVHRYKTFNNGQYDLFAEVEILYYTNSKNNIHILKEISPIKLRTELRKNWKAAALASYFADIISKISLPYHHQDKIYEILDESLQALNTPQKPNINTLFSFELQTLNALGFAPSLDQCSFCGKELKAEIESNYFSARNGGIICKRCYTKQQNHPNDLYLRKDVENIMRFIQKTPKANIIKLSKHQETEIQSFLHNFIHHHIELYEYIKSRELAIQMFNTNI